MRGLRRGTAIGFGIAVVAASLVTSGSASSDATGLRFKGHAVRTLPVFRVSRPSTLLWTNSGSFFQISSNNDFCYDGAVTSEAHQGTTYIPPGRYGSLRVRAIGAWTITIHAGVENLGTPIRISGSGQRALPPFRLRTAKTMYWTNTGDRFQIIPTGPRDDGVVSSARRSGRTHLGAGRYRLVVDPVDPEGPIGSWSISIR
jgi:hypothetical protein